MGIAFVLLAAYLIYNTYEPPSCIDGKQNRNETGVDCGGVCVLLCPFEIQDLRISWTRGFKMGDGLYGVVAYVENPNYNSYTLRAPYQVRVYDKEGKLITERKETTFLSGEAAVPIYVGRLETADQVPYRVVFEFENKDAMKWYRREWHHQLVIEERQVMKPVFGSEVQAVLNNASPLPVDDVEVVVLVYDSNENVITASKTIVDRINGREKRRLTFSWPTQFSVMPERLEFVARAPVPE